jgi:catechol 2,3-dioxygenase-like lactoylglutathione lyase family enzyme
VTFSDRPSLRWTGVCLDCADAEELAQFYTRLLGWQITAGANTWFQLSDPAGGVGLNIQAEEWYQPPVWPEQPGARDKMLHFEIAVSDVNAAVAYAVAAGATVASPQPTDRDLDQMRVMLDPAGHPFCLYNDDAP